MARQATGLKRAVFIGCSHGSYVDPEAFTKVMAFVNDYKPHKRVHLGDAWDMAAFRSGASGSPDEGFSIREDFKAGMDLLAEFEPNLFMYGNHEDRLFHLLDHPRETVAEAAHCTLEKMETLFKRMKCESVPYGSVADPDSWRMIGDTLVGHGFYYGENATRDHVELLGHPVIHAHDHKAKIQSGRVVGNHIGYSVGTLANIGAMRYAKSRKATASWSAGLVYGEYREGFSQWHVLKLASSKPIEWKRSN